MYVWRRLRHMQLRQEAVAADASRRQSGRAGGGQGQKRDCASLELEPWSAGGLPGAAFFPGVRARGKGGQTPLLARKNCDGFQVPQTRGV